MLSSSYLPKLPYFRTLFPILPQILLPFVVVLAVAAPPFPSRGIVGASLILGVVGLTFLSPWPQETQMRYGILNSWFYWLPVVVKLVCSGWRGDVEKKYHRHRSVRCIQNPRHGRGESTGQITLEKEARNAGVKEKDAFPPPCKEKKLEVDSNHDENEALHMRAFSVQKLLWAAELFANPRGVGWNFALKSTILRPAKYTNSQRSRFLVSQFLRFLLIYLIVDAGTTFLGFYGTKTIPKMLESVGRDVEGSKDGVGRSIIATVVWGVVIRCNWEFMWLVASIFAVGSGISGPENWPPLFGEWKECGSVGGFWGGYWQGVLKQSLLTLSKFLNRLFQIPNHTSVSYLTHLLTGFFISGFFHALVLSNLTVDPPIPRLEIWVSNLTFFLIQIIPIILENWIGDIVDSLETMFEIERSENGAWSRAKMGVGLCWTVAWLVGTACPYLGLYMRVGMGEWKVPVSFCVMVMDEWNRGLEGWLGIPVALYRVLSGEDL